MDGSVLDALTGKHYDLKTFENDRVKVESAGRSIRVGIKNRNGQLFSWWEPSYPFAPPPRMLLKQDEWDFDVEAPTPEVTRAIFTRGDERHVLTLMVTDPAANPKPVQVTWD